MERLNYHHLLYFWLVVREGGLARAASVLRLSHPTVSAQIRALEESLGAKLFERRGRQLVLTDKGRLVHGYAQEIFSLGQELVDVVRDRPSERPMRLVVGISEVIPKLLAKQLLAPARAIPGEVRLFCREDKTERLLAELASHSVDIVFSDRPLPPSGPVRGYNHLLGESGITIFAARKLAQRLRPGFPRSLHGAGILLPAEATVLRRALDHWFRESDCRPIVRAEFDDLALLKAFGEDGEEVFPAHTAVEDAVRRQYRVEVVGRLPEVRERFYAISAERRITHPAVLAICETARNRTLRQKE